MQAAAERLSRIVPNVESRGVNLSIPMPGHPVAKEAEVTRICVCMYVVCVYVSE